MILVLFVDDGLVAGRNENDMIKILNKLNQEFEITYDAGQEG